MMKRDIIDQRKVMTAWIAHDGLNIDIIFDYHLATPIMDLEETRRLVYLLNRLNISFTDSEAKCTYSKSWI